MPKQLTLFEDKAKNKSHVAESYTGIYGMHKYWSKKPYNIIQDFILRYTKKGEIVIDPFCGSGISITESIFTGRKAIGIDINPSAIFITKQMINKDDLKLALSFSYNEIQNYYPKDNFFHNSRINANRENHIYELFTPRNLMALSLLRDRMEKIENSDVREFFKSYLHTIYLTVFSQSF